MPRVFEMSLIAAADGDRVGKFSVKGAGAEKKKLKSNGARFFGGVESRWSKNHTQKKILTCRMYQDGGKEKKALRVDCSLIRSGSVTEDAKSLRVVQMLRWVECFESN